MRSSSKPNARNAGFSFLEVLAALLLLSALSLALWGGLAGSQGLLQKTIRRLSTSVKLLQLDSAIRQALERVRIPFWIDPETAARQEGERVSFAWLDGEPERLLTFELSDGTVVIAADGGRVGFGPFPAARLKLFREESGKPRGVEVAIRGEAKETRILARCGGSP